MQPWGYLGYVAFHGSIVSSFQSGLLVGQRLVLHRGTIEELILVKLLVGLTDLLSFSEFLQLLGLCKEGLLAKILASKGHLVTLLPILAQKWIAAYLGLVQEVSLLVHQDCFYI